MTAFTRERSTNRPASWQTSPSLSTDFTRDKTTPNIIRFCDRETNKRLVFLTNNFDLPAETIAALYKKRWQVELFFKWIKQNLRIKHFYGTSQNAVKTQIWIAVSVYVLAAIIKKELAPEISLYTFLQILSVRPFEKIQISSAFLEIDDNFAMPVPSNQLNLFVS